MRGLLHYGEQKTSGGRARRRPPPASASPSKSSDSRSNASKPLAPPARLNGRTIDYSKAEIQPGDDHPEPFSFLNNHIDCEQIHCWITYTNQQVHDIIRASLDRAPMYTGQIQSDGPRYCPSVETKIVRFADKERHQVFLEPEGRNTTEVYVNGLATSLPRDVQDAMIPGNPVPWRMPRSFATATPSSTTMFLPNNSSRRWRPRQLTGLYMAGQDQRHHTAMKRQADKDCSPVPTLPSNSTHVPHLSSPANKVIWV